MIKLQTELNKYGSALRRDRSLRVQPGPAGSLRYAAIEVDLKLTKDVPAQVVLSHDTALMRHTNIDGVYGKMDYEQYAWIQDETGKENLQVPSNASSAIGKSRPAISHYTRDKIKQYFKYYKRYDLRGAYVEDAPVSQVSSIFLDDLLRNVEAGSGDYAKLQNIVWIYDIQDFQTLKAVARVVDEQNAWDRSIFKVWTPGFPVKYDPDGVTLTLDVQGAGLPAQMEHARFILANSGGNVRMSGVNPDYSKPVAIAEWEVNYYSTEQKRTFWVPMIHGFVGAWQSHVRRRAMQAGPDIFGWELMMNGVDDPVSQKKDEAVGQLGRWLDHEFVYINRWGVARAPDYVCSQRLYDKGECGVFDVGYYTLGTNYFRQNSPEWPAPNPTDDMNNYPYAMKLSKKTQEVRASYAQTRPIQIEDGRWPARGRYIQHPYQRALISPIVVMVP